MLDEIDRLLLAALQADARATYRDLGERVSLSPPAVAARMRRLLPGRTRRGVRELQIDGTLPKST